LTAPASDAVEIVGLGGARCQPLHCRGDRREPEDAGSALTRALRREIGEDPGGRLHATALRGEEVNHAAAERQAARAHRPGVHWQTPLLVDIRPSAEITAEEHRLGLTAEATGDARDI